MKTKQTLIYAILSLASIMWLLDGCYGNDLPTIDRRLVKVDSILRRNAPDSALRLLTAIDADLLPNPGDQAFHALLLTQAQYRCYADITSDSTINVALDYYKRHNGESEKLTRSYLYKGAVTEVLGHPVAAMTCYKQAMSTAADEDHFNLGYAKLRIGSLYRDYLTADYPFIRLFKEALQHFEQVPDSFYIATCLSSIGNCYCALEKYDSALVYLELVESLSKALHLTDIELINQVYLADVKMNSNNPQEIEESKAIATSVLRNENCPLDKKDQLVLTAALTLGKLNKADSASMYLKQVNKNYLNNGLRVLYYSCLAELDRCHGDFNQYRYHYKQADDLADSLLLNKQQLLLRGMEAKYDNEALKYKALKYKTNWVISLLGALLAVSILAIALMVVARKASQRKHQLAASEDTIGRLQSDAARLESQLAENQEMNEELKATIKHQIATFTHLVESHYTQFTHFPKKFDALFRRAYDANQPDQSFWAGIRSYADSSCNGIITHTLEKYPLVNENDANFMSLCCCKLPTTVVMVCMGYNDSHSVYNKKHRIEVKLGNGQRFDDYIRSFDNIPQDGPNEN